ncbi:DUF2059 domain-containing protein [Salinispira pacifica]|uniref:DUF2059 domain-containing protein n=1 Tax=Salinispira pacifica TaxID=1307761 RepID=V5WL33_9SPIO|nr:DUF2059 domain-containing protein [Salinispira pacifica]AHC16360.1 hypothetical protein L21SP2_3016 [Salinispira pacifica]
MKRITAIVFFLILAFSLSGQSKADDIQTLLELTNSADLSRQVIEMLIPQYQSMVPDVPGEYWQGLIDEFNGDELMGLIIPIYDRNFTHDEIKDLIAFYESPTGRRFIELQPKIMQESMEAGQKWGMELAQRIQQRLVDDGHLSL